MTDRELWIQLVKIAIENNKYKMSEAVNMANAFLKNAPKDEDK